MITIWQSGIHGIHLLQQAGHGWMPLMRLFSFLGEEQFYMMVMPALLWCVDARLGLRVGVIYLLSVGVNNSLKLIFHAPRPCWIDRRVVPLADEDSFGIPSGHAQNSMAVCGLIAARSPARLPARWAWPAALLLSFCIGLSRVYLAVHFPTDVLGGWLFGALLLWICCRWEAPVLAWLQRCTLAQQVLVALGASLLPVLFSSALVVLLHGWQLPAQWLHNAALASPTHQPPAPLTAAGAIRPAGALFGFAAGAAWLAQRGGFQAGGPLWQRIARYMLGLIGVLLIAEGLGHLLPRGETAVANVLLYLRYALIGGWIAAGAPALFVRLGLARSLTTGPRLE